MSKVAGCSDCGAGPINGEPCAARAERLLALEYASPMRMRVHHLSVTTYQAQHPHSLTSEALAAYDEALIRFAAASDEDPLGDGLRQWLYGQLGESFEGATPVRTNEPIDHERPDWSRTIADVSLNDDGDYVESVSVWASAAGNDLRQLHDES